MPSREISTNHFAPLLWSCLNRFLESIEEYGLGLYLLNPESSTTADMLTNPRNNVKNMEKVRTQIQRGLRLPVSFYLFIFGGQGCDGPIDRIWALFGILSSGFVAKVKEANIIDYSDAGRRDY